MENPMESKPKSELSTWMTHTYMCIYMVGCQNYGPFLGPIIIRPLIFRVPKKGP